MRYELDRSAPLSICTSAPSWFKWVKYRKKVLEDGVVGKISESFGGGSSEFGVRQLPHDFQGKADSGYTTIHQRHTEELSRGKKKALGRSFLVSVIFPRHNGTGKLSDVLKKMRGGGRVMLSYKFRLYPSKTAERTP